MLNIEEALIQEILGGDMNSFERLVYLYKDKIYCFIYKMTSSKEDTEDVVQETFIRVFNNLYKYNSNWKFSTWIYRIAVNVLKNYWKKKKGIYTKELCQDTLKEIDYDTLNNPEDKYLVKEFYMEIISILHQLDYNQKVVFFLRYIKDFSIEEISTIVGVSPGAVRTRIHRTRKKICDQFKNLKEGVFYDVLL